MIEQFSTIDDKSLSHISVVLLYLHETFGPPHSWLASWNPVIINAAKSKACRDRDKRENKLDFKCKILSHNVVAYQQSNKVLVIKKRKETKQFICKNLGTCWIGDMRRSALWTRVVDLVSIKQGPYLLGHKESQPTDAVFKQHRFLKWGWGKKQKCQDDNKPFKKMYCFNLEALLFTFVWVNSLNMAARPSSSMSLSVFMATFRIWMGSSGTLWMTKQLHISLERSRFSRGGQGQACDSRFSSPWSPLPRRGQDCLLLERLDLAEESQRSSSERRKCSCKGGEERME